MLYLRVQMGKIVFLLLWTALTSYPFSCIPDLILPNAFEEVQDCCFYVSFPPPALYWLRRKNGFPNGLKWEGKEKIWFRSQSCCFDKLGKIILSGLMYGCMQIPNYCFGQCLLFGSPGLERCRLYPWNEPLSQMQKLCTKCDGVVNYTVAHAVI